MEGFFTRDTKMLTMLTKHACMCIFKPYRREGMKLGYRMGDLWWPMHAEDVFARRLVQRHEDGKITLRYMPVA